MTTIREQLAICAELRQLKEMEIRLTFERGDLKLLLDDWERDLRDDSEEGGIDVPYNDLDFECHIRMMLMLAAAQGICHTATEEGLIADGFKPDPAKN